MSIALSDENPEGQSKDQRDIRAHIRKIEVSKSSENNFQCNRE